MNATPAPPGAMIGLTLSWDEEYTQQDLAGISRAELETLAQALHQFSRAAESQGGPRVVEMQGATVEPFGKHRALVFRYRRTSPYSASLWQVTQYKIPVQGALIELTLSYRESDATVWRPILGHVKNSLRY